LSRDNFNKKYMKMIIKGWLMNKKTWNPYIAGALSGMLLILSVLRFFCSFCLDFLRKRGYKKATASIGIFSKRSTRSFKL